MWTIKHTKLLMTILMAGIILAGCNTSGSNIPTSTSNIPETTLSPTSAKATETPDLGSNILPTIPSTESSPSITPEETEDQQQIEHLYPIQLTFISNRSGNFGVYAVDIICWDLSERCFSEPQLLFEWNQRIDFLDWSPDGNRLVLGSQGNLFLADWDGENPFQIPSDPGSEIWPVWSPDGSSIAYIYGSDVEPSQIRVYELATGTSKRILEQVISPSRVYWLSGGKIAYISQISKLDFTEIISISDHTGTIVIRMPETNEKFKDLYGLDFSLDESKIVLAGEYGLGDNVLRVHLWNCENE